MKKPATALVFILLFILFLILLAPQVMQVRSLKARSQNLETEIKKLELENRSLENELRLLREDPVYLERVAREKLNKAKEGEIVYKVVREGGN
ncbi:MAG: septum formation initiator family protein [Candidatus Omnitrophica bacterium]|nr:septum formation initiator family protein [Candidatus Omnitrophota bacterium]